MSLNDTFARLLRHHREARKISQEALADRAGLDRTYISQLERGHKSPTLTTLARLASCLDLQPTNLIHEPADPTNRSGPRLHMDYLHRGVGTLCVRRQHRTAEISAVNLLSAIDTAHLLIDEIYGIDLDIASILRLRNLSAFFGELIASAAVKNSGGMLRPNPHQDGYPDLLLMDEAGRADWAKLKHRLNEKKPFSPFPGGGIEIKATCGAIPSPEIFREKGVEKPELGDTRIKCMSSYDWKAHHRETNNLVGIVWDFFDRRPRIAAMFYSCELQPDDWGRIVQPKSGGGRTTSVSIMRRSGIQKMYEGWLCVLRAPGYAEFFNRKNRGDLIPSG